MSSTRGLKKYQTPSSVKPEIKIKAQEQDGGVGWSV